MPIINGHVIYEMPKEYKDMCTIDFLTELRNQLFRMHEYYHLGLFADEGIPINTSTAGWYAAFGKACILCDKLELLKYHKTLEWFDSDIFDDELSNMLIDNHLILDFHEAYFKKYLNLEYEKDYDYCVDCGKYYFSKDLSIALEQIDEEDKSCTNCKGTGAAKSLNDILLEKVGGIENLIENELGIKKESLIICNNCKNIYTKEMVKDTTCFYCLDKLENDEYPTTKYYRDALREIEKVLKE